MNDSLRPAHLIAALFLLFAGCQSPSVTPAQATIESKATQAAASAPAAMVLRGVPPIPITTLERVRQYGNARSAALLGFVGDEMLISTRFAQTSQVHRVAKPGGSRAQLTFFREPIGSVAIPPVANPEGFIYGRDVGGSEFFQLFWFDFASGASRLLSDGKSRYGNVVFDDSGTRFAYSTTERDGVRHDVHINDLQGNKVIVHESSAGWWVPLDFAPDGQRLLMLKYLSINQSELFEADLQRGSVTRLLADQEPVAISNALYSADGQRVFLIADIGTEFTGLHQLQLGSGARTPIPGTSDWDVEEIARSQDGTQLAYVMNVDGISQLYLRDLASGRRLPTPTLPAGLISGLQFHHDDALLGFTLNSATAPADAYTLRVADGTLQRWTESEIGGLDPSRFVAPELIRYPTFDAVDGAPRQIPAFYYRPAQADVAEPMPVVILIHGGPEAQIRPYFSATVQLMAAELGIAVIAPNVRGSAGYGKSYLRLDNGYLREDSVKDIGALLDWIGTRPELDAERVTVYGGSYGGYMVLAALTTFPERLAAGMEAVGISNFVTFLENTEPYRQDLRRVEYGDERIPEMRAFLEKISPLNRIERIRAPLLISQGANDPRVPASESEQIYQALVARNIPAWYVLATDEGHGFRKKANRDFNTAAMVQFLERFVLSKPTSEQVPAASP